jgi:hypothetical protein
MFKVSPASLQTFIYTPDCVLKDHVQCSEYILWCPSSNHQLCGDCSNTLSFSSHPWEKIRQRNIRRSWRPNSLRSDSVCKHIVQECHRRTRCMSCSAILLKVGLVSFIFFQLHNERIHNIVTVPLGVEKIWKKNGSDYVPTRHSNSNTNLLIVQRHLVECMGIVCTQDTWVLAVDVPQQMEICLVCEYVTSKMSFLSWSKKV